MWLYVVLWACGSSSDAGGPSTDDPSGDDDDSQAATPFVMPSADRARYEADLEALAVPRPPKTPGWQAAQDSCAGRLEDLGFDVTLDDYGTGINVIGHLPGASNRDGAVVVSAHYDSVPDCAGADDNASGVAAALEVARLLAGGSWENDLWVACWDEEEAGLVGSTAWADQAKASGARIQLVWSFETLAYTSSEPDSQELPLGFGALFPETTAAVEANDNRGDFIGLIADAAGSTEVLATYQAQADAEGLSALAMLVPEDLLLSPFTADLRRSDHAPFWANGVPAVMVTDTANFRNAAYHCLNGQQDTVERLDVDFAVKVTQVTATTTASLLGSRGAR